MADSQGFEGGDTVVLDDELAFHDVLPIAWEPTGEHLEPFRLAGLDDNNKLLLQACVAMEEHPQREKGEELGPLSAEIARLDFKLSLVLQLLGRLVSSETMAPASRIAFNALGATWSCPKPPAGLAVGDHGLLRIQLRSSLPQLLEIPSQVVAVREGEVRLRFTRVSEAVAEALQRLSFLRHRRWVAEGRKSRGQ